MKFIKNILFHFTKTKSSPDNVFTEAQIQEIRRQIQLENLEQLRAKVKLSELPENQKEELFQDIKRLKKELYG